MLLLGKYKVNGPAAANVRSRTTEVAQHIGVHATGFFQGVGKDGQAVKGPLPVDLKCQTHRVGRAPLGVEFDGPKRVAEHISN